ncbi:MAG TPA: PASTA domain-containing protein [Terriglobales bacterium]|nr:PASTA domain-containing protein [Terriglobales bacterium]
MKTFFRLALLGLVLVMVALISALTAMRFAIHGGEVGVPDLVGKAPAEAKRIVESQGLEVNVERQYYSPSIPEGKIVSQSPTAGTHVRRGWQVRVAASLGPQRIAIPDVVGESERAAEINIRRRGLDVSEVAQIAVPGITSTSQTPDQVISQSPPANASGIAAPKISLLVNAPPQPQAFVMPSFVGQQLGRVTSILQGTGMRLGNVTVAAQPTNNVDPNISLPVQSPSSVIVSQSPAAGEKIIAGATISLVVR